MVISISGLGWTGSSAVNDLLKEYDDVEIPGFDDEMCILYIPDGILDLEYHLCKMPLRFFSGDIAIMRFVNYLKKEKNTPNGLFNRLTNGNFYDISMKYVESITQMKWRGRWFFDIYLCRNELERTLKFRVFERIENLIHRKIHKDFNTFLDRTMYLSIYPDDFHEKTKKYFEDLFVAMGLDINKKLILNQLFAGNNLTAGMHFFDEAKAILVERDPRDMYLLCMRMGYDNKWCLADCVENFVKYYKYVRRNMELNSPNVLMIHFEDLVYKYDETRTKIETFLDIKEHVRKKQFFNPEKSIHNTQLFLFGDKYNDDIKYIEEHLSEYLYDFSSFTRPELDEKSIF